jgi:D-hexose-6-phosphate mutarotase
LVAVIRHAHVTRSIFCIQVVYSISLHGEVLRTDMRVLNTGDSDFDFTAALHTYFEVAGIEKAKVTGLKGLVSLNQSLPILLCASDSLTKQLFFSVFRTAIVFLEKARLRNKEL